MIEFRSISKSAATHHDALCFAAPKMAGYMMARARKIASDLKCDMYLLSPYDTRISVLSNELEEILTILKDAGIEIKKDGEL